MDLSEAVGPAALVAMLAAVTALVIGPSIWSLIDASRTPDAAWAQAGRKKSNWVVAFAIGIWAWFVGLPAAIVYLRRVRPELRSAMASAGSPPPPGFSRSNRALIVVGVVLASLWILGMWAYVTHGHDEFFDQELAAEANAICTDAKTELSGLPPLPESPTYEERAESGERTIPIFRGTVTRLRALAEPGENETYDQWIEDWQEFIDLGQSYAHALRTGDPAVFEPAGHAVDEPATAINEVARANEMESCVF